MKRELEWVRWWCFAWLDAEPSWEPNEPLLSHRQRHRLAKTHHQTLGALFGVTPLFPYTVNEAIMEVALASNEQLNKLMVLASATCQPMQDYHLTAHEKQWCESIARGLKPGQWLDEQQDPLFLLRHWINDDAVWQRIRLRFPRDRVELIQQSPPPSIPTKKLDTFWQAMTWRLFQPS